MENGTPSPRSPSFPPPPSKHKFTPAHPHTHTHTHAHTKNMADPKGEETGKEENSGAEAEAEPTTAAGMMAAMARHGDGTNVMKESIQTFSNVDGVDRKGDVMVPATDMGQARASIGAMLEEARAKAKADGKKKEKKKKKKAGAGGEDMWDFGATPFSEFGRTLDDLLGAFLLWARTGGEEEEEEEEGDDAAASSPDRQINVTKAFRRLENYAEWMQDNSEELTAEPLTAASVRDDLEPWKMSTSPDRRGRLVWWIDLGQMDVARVKEQSPAGVLRAFVWYAHYVLFDERAQTRGMVFMENCAEMGFIQSITLVPMSVGTKLDRLTMGVLPIKMKALYIFEVAMWMSLFMKMAGMFVSSKMKERILICDDYSGVEEIVALEHIPKGFGTLQGGMEKDEAETKYLGK